MLDAVTLYGYLQRFMPFPGHDKTLHFFPVIGLLRFIANNASILGM